MTPISNINCPVSFENKPEELLRPSNHLYQIFSYLRSQPSLIQQEAQKSDTETQKRNFHEEFRRIAFNLCCGRVLSGAVRPLDVSRLVKLLSRGQNNQENKKVNSAQVIPGSTQEIREESLADLD